MISLFVSWCILKHKFNVLKLWYRYIAKTIHGGDDDDDDEVSSENHNLEEPKVLGVKPGTDEKVYS